MIRSSANGYGLVAILFHWIMAVLILFMLGLGLYMHEQDITAQETFELYQLHKSFGFVALALVLLRLVWRISSPVPGFEPGMKSWEKLAARIGHSLLYILMFVMPLSGWLMASASPWEIPTFIFNTLNVPHFPFPESWGTKEQVEEFFKKTHEFFAWMLILTLLVHIGAALKHHFIARDNTLRRILSVGPVRKN